MTAPGANLYYTVYFLATGLHAFHVIVGMSILIWVLARVLKGRVLVDSLRPGRAGRPLLAPRRPGLDLPLSAALPDLAYRRINRGPRTSPHRSRKSRAPRHGAGRYWLVWVILLAFTAITV